ncbi:MAG TPA: hypothetical protein VII06_07945 [Chloroflexota bacterium]|jgi:hypothetical protein
MSMITLQPGPSSHASVWLDELPPLTYPPSQVMELCVAARPGAIQTARRAAIERTWPSCGPSSYGLLGAEFIPAPTEQIQILVHCSDNQIAQAPFEDVLPRGPVRIGLLDEYGKAVLAGAAAAAELLGAGTLRFDHAAHDLVGSSPVVFAWLASGVVELLALPSESLDRLRLLDILRRPQRGPAAYASSPD